MNKAFVREPDATEELCPRCGSQGQSVSRATIARHVRDPDRIQIAEVANFCPAPHCDVVYFDMFERTIRAAALRAPIYPKDPSAPICVCLGLTGDDLDRDIAEGVVTRTKACVAHAQSPAARCAELAANGRSCVAEVQRYYLQRKNSR